MNTESKLRYEEWLKRWYRNELKTIAYSMESSTVDSKVKGSKWKAVNTWIMKVGVNGQEMYFVEING